MQEREFDKVMSGINDAKWAELTEEKDKPLMERLKTVSKIPEKDIPRVRRQIQECEVEIPAEKRAEMDEFIAQQRRFSVPEQNIRRKVKKKFGIVVV